jgi:hypothetical protein
LAAIASIEANSSWIGVHAARLQHAVDVLDSISAPAVGPDDELATAERILSDTLADIRQARRKFQRAEAA